MKQLFESWNRYVDNDDRQLIREELHQKLIQENIGALIAQGVIALLQTEVGRRIIAWSLRVPEKLATAVFEPMRKWSRPTLEDKLGADSKVLAVSDWMVDNVGFTGPQGLVLGKLADLIEGLDDKDAKDLVQLGGEVGLAEQKMKRRIT